MKKRKLSKNTKIIILIVTVILIIILNVILNTLEKKENENKNENKNKIVATTGFDSIEDILNYYGCEFIKETSSKEKDFSKDIYLKFKYNTFEGEESNQRYYENVISHLCNLINESFRLIDEDKDLLIKVSKQENEDETVNFVYVINGQEDFFKVNEAKINLQNYEENKDINIQINSNILNQLKENNWKKNNIDFGSKDSTFNKYDIYFDEGIELRTISGNLFNIIFTSRYYGEVINGIGVGKSFEEIIDKLGEPTFGSKEGSYIGYKNSEIYVFFLENKISIYRNEEKVDMQEFDEILMQYVEEKIDIKEFMNKLTYLWPDYEEYKYDSNYIYINYPNKGIRIEMYSDTPAGIKIYKNCNITEKISKLIEEGKITSKLENDLNVVTLEKKEQMENDGYIYIANMFFYDGEGEEIEERKQMKSNLYHVYKVEENEIINKVLFISKNENNPNTELNEKINQGFFISDEIFIYSIKNKGIYAINVITKEKTTLVTGEEEFKLEEFKDNILKYDEKQISLIME